MGCTNLGNHRYHQKTINNPKNSKHQRQTKTAIKTNIAILRHKFDADTRVTIVRKQVEAEL